MADNRNPHEKQPGKYHYNPGNQSGKSVEVLKPESEQESNVDKQGELEGGKLKP